MDTPTSMWFCTWLVFTKGCASYRVLSRESVRNRCGCVFLPPRCAVGLSRRQEVGYMRCDRIPLHSPSGLLLPTWCYVRTFEVTSGRFALFPASAPRLEMACVGAAWNVPATSFCKLCNMHCRCTNVAWSNTGKQHTWERITNLIIFFPRTVNQANWWWRLF